MTDLYIFLLIDAVIVFICLCLMINRLSIWHPLTHFLFYHGYVVTYRTWRLTCGALTMNAHTLGREAIRYDEIERAIVYADLTLVMFTIGSLMAHRIMRKRLSTIKYSSFLNAEIEEKHILLVCATCFPIGLCALIISRLGFAETYYGHLAMVAFWPIGCLLLGVFYYGFKWYFMLPIGAYLSIVGLQGFHRFMILFPLIFLISVYLERLGRRWPSVLGWALCAFVVLMFPEWKYVGIEFQKNGLDAAVERAAVAFSIERRDERVENLLDQLAGALTLLDKQGKVYYGITYFYFLIMPVPRAWWPDKPAINQYIIDFSTPSRPYHIEGRIATITGESYANFLDVGVIAIPFLLGLFLTFWCIQAERCSKSSLLKYFYLVFTTTFIQVFRDGLSSFFMFGFFQNVPLLLIVLLAWVNRPSEKKSGFVVTPGNARTRSASHKLTN